MTHYQKVMARNFEIELYLKEFLVASGVRKLRFFAALCRSVPV
jgi:hypothetical protein